MAPPRMSLIQFHSIEGGTGGDEGISHQIQPLLNNFKRFLEQKFCKKPNSYLYKIFTIQIFFGSPSLV